MIKPIENDFTLGTDAEFVVTNNRYELIQANEYTPKGPMGSDGNGRTWEVRSKPSRNPVDLIRSVRKIFDNYIKEYPQFMGYNWEAGGYPYEDCPTGLHVHFGINRNQTNCEQASLFLSNYVGAISLLIEDKQQARNRRNWREHGYYGFMTDFRHKAWGWEYRSMSSSLINPYVTTALLCLSKVLMYEFQNNKKLSYDTYITDRDFCNHNVGFLKKDFPKLWKDITKMSLYQTYKPYIDILHFLVTNNLTWYPKNRNMKEAWGLIDTGIPASQIDMEAIWFKWKNKKQGVVGLGEPVPNLGDRHRRGTEPQWVQDDRGNLELAPVVLRRPGRAVVPVFEDDEDERWY